MYLRYPRIGFFLLTAALCGVEVGLAAWSVARAYELMDEAKHTLPGASLDVSDALAVGGAVTGASGIAALLCLFLLFMTVFRPNKAETLKGIRFKEGIYGVVLLLWIGTLIPATYYTATKSGVINAPGVPDSIIQALVKAAGKDLRYNKQVPIMSYLIVGWIAFLSTLITFILTIIAARKTLKYGADGNNGAAGPMAHHERVTSRSADSSPYGDSRPSMGEKHAVGNTSAERIA
ncbi:hypothetical protein JCM8547_008215 [Rhodosporidiobolus lusitaniae]